MIWHHLFFSTSCFFVVVIISSFPSKIPTLVRFLNCLPCKKIKHGCNWRMKKYIRMRGEKMGTMQYLKNQCLVFLIKNVIYCIHCEFCDDSPCDSLHYPSSTINLFMFWKKKLTQYYPNHAKTKLQEKWKDVAKNDILYYDFKI